MWDAGLAPASKNSPSCLIRLSGKNAEIEYLPAGLTFVTNRIGSTEAAERDLGYKWTVDLEEGMHRLIDWRRSYIAELAARKAGS